MAMAGPLQPRRVRGRHRLTTGQPATRPGNLTDLAFLASGYLARCVSALVILTVIGSVAALATPTPEQSPAPVPDPAATAATHRVR